MMLAAFAVLSLTAVVFLAGGARTTAYLLYFLAFLPFLSLDPASGGLRDLAGLGGLNVLLKLSVRTATTLGIVLLLARRRDVLRAALHPSATPIALYVLWALCGLHRTHAPWIALLRLGELAAFYLVGVALYLEAGRFHSPRTLARWHALALLPISLSALVFAQWMPEVATHRGPGGLRLGHKFVEANVLGFAAAVTLTWACFELTERREQRRGYWAERVLPLCVFAVSLFVLVFARSRTAMVAAIAGQFLLWAPQAWHSAMRRRRGALVLATLGIAALLGARWTAAWFLRGDSVAELATATGRVGLWKALLGEEVLAHPLLGAGYLMLGGEGSFVHDGTRWNNAHNTFVFALVSTGVPGLLCVLTIACLPLWGALQRAQQGPVVDRPAWMLFAALQVLVLVTSITGFGISGYPNAVMLYHFAAYTTCTLGARANAAVHERAAPVPLAPGSSEVLA